MGIRSEVQKRVIQKRQGIGGREILTVNGLKDTDEFHYHWINDIGDRLSQRYNEGYEFVDKGGLIAGDITVESARGTDSLMKKGVGRGVTAYLMKIPMDLYKEYQDAKLERANAIDEEIRGSGKHQGMYGEVKVS